MELGEQRVTQAAQDKWEQLVLEDLLGQKETGGQLEHVVQLVLKAKKERREKLDPVV